MAAASCDSSWNRTPLLRPSGTLQNTRYCLLIHLEVFEDADYTWTWALVDDHDNVIERVDDRHWSQHDAMDAARAVHPELHVEVIPWHLP
jgi:hypothetical protein